MSVKGSSLFETKVKQFGMLASHERFQKHYVDAINNSLVWLTVDLNLSSQPDDIDATDDDIDLNAEYRPVLEAAVDYWLVLYGNKSGDPKTGLTLDRAKVIYMDAVATACGYRDQVEQAAATDNEVIGLVDE